MTRLPDILTPADLPLAVLCAARLDGHVFPLGAAFLPVDLPDTAHLRALAVLRGLGAPARFTSRLIAAGESARWIWGERPLPPAVHEMLELPGGRVSVPAAPGYAITRVSGARERALRTRVRLLGPVRVLTEPHRTQHAPEPRGSGA